VHGISSAHYLPQEFIDNSIMAFLRLQRAYQGQGLPLPQDPRVLLLHCFPGGGGGPEPEVASPGACILVMDNACGMSYKQLANNFLVIGRDKDTLVVGWGAGALGGGGRGGAGAL
jgi:hypothetical protein